MICLYCTNEVTPDSRLAHLQVCSSCAAVDEKGNREQIELGRKITDVINSRIGK